LKDKTAPAHYTKDAVTVDADLKEWPDSMFLSVAGSAGRARFASAWTKEYLYFAIQVEDDYLFSDVDTTRRYFPFKNNDTTGYLPLWLGDFTELCFNPKNIYNSIRSKSHKEVLFSIQGIAEANNTDFIEERVYLWGNNIKTAYQLKGSLNKHDDMDTGYVIETAIPWSDLDVKPASGLSIGFDFFYQDFSEKGSKAIRETWSGISAVNNDNPSEWGKLTLVKEKSWLFTFLIILICITAAGFGIILLRWNKSRLDKEKPVVTSESIQRAITFIQENYSKEMSLSEIAKAASLSPTWLSTAFKKEVKIGLSQYIMEFRIKKSCELLLNTKKSVTEIAYLTGFKDQSHFTKIFKKLKKTTPSEFRQNS
jgi:AraC-like DNA-binding protein